MTTEGARALPGAGEKRSSTHTKRLIYFRGHHLHRNSVLITQVCQHYETVSYMLCRDMECATRTLSNLYNLHAVRGRVTASGELVADSAMSGPHHYFGYLDPYASHTVSIDPSSHLPQYFQHKDVICSQDLAEVPSQVVTRLSAEQFTWMSGVSLAKRQRMTEEAQTTSFALDHTDEEESVMDGGVLLRKARTPTSTASCTADASDGPVRDRDLRVSDSLFAYPGVLTLRLPAPALHLPLLSKAHGYDLSSFGAQVVPNDQPFCFPRAALDSHRHAQHKLRLITYNYGERYVSDYLMAGNGVFVERHEFIQCITPLQPSCGGFVILGRERTTEEGGASALELVAVTVPFGQTLLVHPYALHGDSHLTGLYSMGMTGNHHAMATADSVFLKDARTGENVAVVTSSSPPSPCSGDSDICAGETLLLSSDRLDLPGLHARDEKLKADIANTIAGGEYDSDDDVRAASGPLGIVQRAVAQTRKTLWHPVIFTLRGDGGLAGVKTVGSRLPPIETTA